MTPSLLADFAHTRVCMSQPGCSAIKSDKSGQRQYANHFSKILDTSFHVALLSILCVSMPQLRILICIIKKASDYVNMHGLRLSLRQVLFAKRVPVKQEVKPPVAVWLEQTVR